jgi:hypothetical protein
MADDGAKQTVEAALAERFGEPFDVRPDLPGSPCWRSLPATV